jgi:DNA-binding CsgD family transcriptional regulator
MSNALTKDILEDLYIKKDLSSTKIGKIFGVSGVTIRNYLKKFKIPIKPLNHYIPASKGVPLSQEAKQKLILINTKYSKDKYNKDLFYKEYIINQKSSAQIANELGMSKRTVFKFLKLYNIEIRNDNFYKNNPNIERPKSKIGPDNPEFTSIKKICKYCLEEYYVQLHRSNDSIYCSKSCFHDDKSVIVNCKICNKEKKIPKHTFSKFKNHFCSNLCRDTYNKDKTKEKHHQFSSLKMKCGNKECNNDIYIKQCHIRKSKTKLFFCSRKCLKKHGAPWRHGRNNPMWTGGYNKYYGPKWNKIKKRILKRDNNICQKCNKNKAQNNKNMDVHHIVPFKLAKNNDGSQNYIFPNIDANLISLCNSCHKSTEIEFVKFFKSLTEYWQSYISTSTFVNNFYNSPNSIPQEIQETILKYAPQNIKSVFISNLPIIKSNLL